MVNNGGMVNGQWYKATNGFIGEPTKLLWTTLATDDEDDVQGKRRTIHTIDDSPPINFQIGDAQVYDMIQPSIDIIDDKRIMTDVQWVATITKKVSPPKEWSIPSEDRVTRSSAITYVNEESSFSVSNMGCHIWCI